MASIKLNLIANVDATAKGIDQAIASLPDLAGQIGRLITRNYIQQARKLAPIGEEGNSTDPPGEMAKSIRGIHVSSASPTRYSMRVGVYVNFARQRSLGGHIVPKKALYDLKFVKFGVIIKTQHVWQEPNPYLDEAKAITEAAAPAIASVPLAIWTTTLSGGR